MVKKEFDDKMKELFNLYETEETLEVEERINRLKDIVKFAKEYNSIYKNPYKHYFMGKNIKISNNLIGAFETLILDAENYFLNNE